MLNALDFIRNHPGFKQFTVDKLTFVTYDCPIEESPFDYWTPKNYFAFITKGGLRWKTPRQDYVVHQGDAVFIKKGAHRVYKILSGEFCALMIFLPDDFICTTLREEALNGCQNHPVEDTDTVIRLKVDPTLSDYFAGVLNYFAQSTAPSKSLLKVKFKELIINILTSSSNPALSSYFQSINMDKKHQLQNIMEENFVYNLSLEEYARLCGRSLASFKRDFEKVYHSSPGKWLKKKRLAYAKFLLETTELNVSEITLEAGFENTSHFIRNFKKKYHYPPLQFRKSVVEVA
ncbi:AraC-like DNA-binding protein [Catalinimonas alkaloidigena]|uniref:helix-turn-helix domain-containing protein n=1 Tax=Catalinimonas alkaloidigena TaxID=1075417 RepID=UPI002405A1C4|nr:AraC family transcriptional regulator [Catalinimonas alkaloidigena]MDF9794950.1 AraC-like DNA-binding protein [Catalinimonas alkaloidigena]